MNIFNSFPDVVKVGVWGPPGSGKTTYMIMLQFDEDHIGWKIKPLGWETQEIYLDGTDRMREQLRFVDPTPLETKYMNFDFEGPVGGFFQRDRTFRVVIPEAPGEFYEKPEIYPELLDEISRYQGILWLVDPEQIDNPPERDGRRSYRRMIQQWLYSLYDKQGRRGSLKHYMAFCLTKMDMPNHYAHINNPKDYCLDKLGTDVQKFLETYCDLDRISFFATSSIGVDKNHATNLELTDPDLKNLRNPAHPINLFQPFDWLFSVL